MSGTHLVLVTGASRGLGAAMVRQLLEAGHRVAACARGAAPLVSDRLRWTPLDLVDALAAHDWASRAVADGPRPQAVSLILNAGMVEPVAAVEDLRADAVETHMRLNLVSPMLTAAGFLQATADWAVPRRVLAISSGAARRGIAQWSAYCAAKAGLDNFVRALNAEGRVRAVSLAPGIIDTAMQAVIRSVPSPQQERFRAFHEQGELATPEDAARAVLGYLGRDDFGAVDIADVRD